MERLRILVVDDELALANLIEKYLRRMGFDVEPVSDSRLALERFRAAEVPFHLVLADLTMPQLSGEELLRTILRSDPNVRAILCSGGPTSPSAPSMPGISWQEPQPALWMTARPRSGLPPVNRAASRSVNVMAPPPTVRADPVKVMF